MIRITATITLITMITVITVISAGQYYYYFYHVNYIYIYIYVSLDTHYMLIIITTEFSGESSKGSHELSSYQRSFFWGAGEGFG